MKKLSLIVGSVIGAIGLLLLVAAVPDPNTMNVPNLLVRSNLILRTAPVTDFMSSVNTNGTDAATVRGLIGITNNWNASNVSTQLVINFATYKPKYWFTLTNGNVLDVVFTNMTAGASVQWNVRGCSTNSTISMTNSATSKPYPGVYPVVIPAYTLCTFTTEVGPDTNSTNTLTAGFVSAYVP